MPLSTDKLTTNLADTIAQNPAPKMTATPVATTTFPCSTDILEGLPNSRLTAAVVAAAAGKQCDTVISRVSGMYTAESLAESPLPPVPTAETVLVQENKLKNVGASLPAPYAS